MEHPDYESLHEENHRLRVLLADERWKYRRLERETLEAKAELRRLKADLRKRGS